MISVVGGAWRSVKLSEILLEGPTNGYSPQSAEDAEGTLSLRLSATTQGYMLLNDQTTKRLLEKIALSSPLWLRPDDLLVQRSNTMEYLGSAAIYDGPERTYIYPDLMMRLRFHDVATTRWVWRFLNARGARDYFRRVAGGTAGSMPKISGAKLRELVVPLPPLEEQRRIAAILDRAETIRRKRQEAIALTEQLLRSTFLEMFGDPVTNPKRWPETLLADTFSARPQLGTMKPAHADGECAVVRVGELGSRHIDFEACGRVSLKGADFEKVQCFPGDLLLARAIGSEDHLGKASIVGEFLTPVVFDSHVMRLRFNPSLVLPTFFYHWLASDGGRARFLRQAGRTAVQFNVNGDQIGRVVLPLPPLKMQQRWQEVEATLNQYALKHQLSLASARSLFDSLVQRAFSGQL